MKSKMFLALGLVSFFATSSAQAASANGIARARVLAPLTLENLQDLNFGDALPGSGEKVVDTTDTTNSAKFRVQGVPGLGLSVTLPSSIVLVHADGQEGVPEENIDVTDFVSTLNTGDQLSSTDAQDFYVGAKRAALLSNQRAGDYSAQFTVTVDYSL